MRAIAAIPSLSPDVEALRRLVETLQDTGIDPQVVANSARLVCELDAAEIGYRSRGRNLGFGDSIRDVAADGDWELLLIVNDDLELDPAAFAAFWKDWSARVDRADIAYLCPDEDRPIPGRRETFESLSLLGRVRSALHVAARPIAGRPAYQSFSMVAVSRAAWDALGGLDAAIPFTYEDADFIRRALDAGYRCVAETGTGAVHRHSVTTSQHIRAVLPVSAYSALVYLDKWHPGHRRNAALIVAALVLRVPLAGFTRAAMGEHLRGIGAAIRAVTGGPRPELPGYGAL